jgi:uncharacterized membrane protein YbhN (UPF0104 family)
VVIRIFTTALVLLLAFGAFWSDALDAGYVLNPVGILLLSLAGSIWFLWEPFRDAFVSAKEESNIPIIRLGSAIIAGLRRTPPGHREGARNSSEG